MKVKIDEIKVNSGRRAALENDIEELAFSISEIGLLNPITLTGDYTLIAGLHRLEAVKLLGWTEVECVITELEGLTAELAELDENFARANLSPLEIGELYKRRKDIYEALYPEVKAGTAQAIGMNKAKGNNVDCNLQSRRKSFIEDTASVTGSHPSTIARHIKIATELTPEAKETLREAKKPVSSTTLKKISKLAPNQQKEVSSLLVSGEIQTVEEYLAARQPQKSESAAGEKFPKGQLSAMMGMAYFADATIAHANDFLNQADVFAQMSRENLMDILKMMDAINSSVRALGDVITNCYVNS
ncbi:MAG: ParB N-terminal domain-containing protein [Oscillospiraceae bacterium]|jgi:ParB family chromosome partitioning protein|nr:ParB N-terminal domain-containing protein [Oscillospiraceae bacterium]